MRIILVFRTSIATQKAVKATAQYFNKHPDIINWSVDLEDWENILRIEANNTIAVDQIIAEIEFLGYDCQELE